MRACGKRGSEIGRSGRRARNAVHDKGVPGRGVLWSAGKIDAGRAGSSTSSLISGVIFIALRITYQDGPCRNQQPRVGWETCVVANKMEVSCRGHATSTLCCNMARSPLALRVRNPRDSLGTLRTRGVMQFVAPSGHSNEHDVADGRTKQRRSWSIVQGWHPTRVS